MMIRDMMPEDVPVVATIEEACFSQPWSRKSFLDSIAREDTLFLVCVDEENVPQGYVGMYLSFDEAEITNVAVNPESRKRGYGDALVTAAKSKARDREIQQILLEVRYSNEPAISLYTKHGFEEIGIRKGFYEFPTEDARIMSCQLSI